MNTLEYVKFANDTNYIPVRWAVVEVAVGGSTTATTLWLKCAGLGWDTEENLKEYADGGNHNRTGKTGTLDEYIVTTLDQVVSYARPSIPVINLRVG